MVEKLSKAVLFLLTPVLGVFLIEYFIRGSYVQTTEWVSGSAKLFIFSIVIYMLVQLLLVALVNNVYLGLVLTGTFWSLLTAINYYKLEMMGNPLLPWDFLFANQIFDLIPAIYNSLNVVALLGSLILVIALGIFIVKKTSFKTFPWFLRLPLILLSVALLLAVYNFKDNFVDELIKKTGAVTIIWNQTINQQTNGLIVGFIVNIPKIQVEQPIGYSEGEITSIVENAESLSSEEYKVTDLKPNIVIVMSEAFWELSNLGLDLNGESLNPTVDSTKIGQIISSNYGGGTSNIEFEALTGFSIANLMPGAIPYQQYMGRKLPSLAWTLKDNGYSTSAIHTYHKYFWNREQAYDSLGFDEFIGLEDLEQPKMFGSLYVDDEVINEQILETLEVQENPAFIYAVTMQNHGLYNDQRYGSEQLKVTDEYTDITNQSLNNLATGIVHSDDVLKRLYDDIEALNEPTLVVFFGDHLPSMTDVYIETGFVADFYNQTLEETLKMKETPLSVWNNYGKDIEQVGSVSTSFLGPKILKWAEIKSPLYYNLLTTMSEGLPGYTLEVKMDQEGRLSTEVPPLHEQLVNKYNLIQYDMMFGNRYSENELFKSNPYNP